MKANDEGEYLWRRILSCRHVDCEVGQDSGTHSLPLFLSVYIYIYICSSEMSGLFLFRSFIYCKSWYCDSLFFQLEYVLDILTS